MMNRPKKTIGVFGSAFNPPHAGHLDVIAQMDGHYGQILLVPSFKHGFGKHMESFVIRCAMAKALIESKTYTSIVQVLDIERNLAMKKEESLPVYTWDLLTAIAEHYQTDSIDFIMGPDNAKQAQWQRFYRAADIEDRWGLAVAEERLNIRSSLIRTTLNNGEKVSNTFIPESVIHIIENHDLYKGEIK